LQEEGAVTAATQAGIAGEFRTTDGDEPAARRTRAGRAKPYAALGR
jgi:hypothetical protein